MDITELFKSFGKTIRARNRACGLPEPERQNRAPRSTDSFSYRAKQVRDQAVKLEKLVIDTKPAYLNSTGLILGVPEMTDAERDRIDWAVPRIASQANSLLKELEIGMERADIKEQQRQHQDGVIQLLRKMLRHITGIHSEMKDARVGKSKEIKQLSRLDTLAKKDSYEADTVITKPVIPAWTPQDDENEDNALSPEELQVFEEENEALQLELNNLTVEIQQLEGKVAGIAKLQDEFTQKVLEQERDIDRVATAVVGTTENIRDANEQLRQAIQRNAGFRVYILFFLLVMSFSLLFLDWYNA